MKACDQYAEKITRHYSQQFGTPETLHWSRGPTHQLPDGFRVLRFPPSPSSRLFTFATCGMALAGDQRAIECFLLSPVPDESQVELLTVIAWFHATTARLGIGHTVNFGRAWMPDSECTHGLLSLPYLHGPSLERFDDAGRQVQILWLIPITQSERDFAARFGFEAVESRFESVDFDYANPHRSSVVDADELPKNV